MKSFEESYREERDVLEVITEAFIGLIISLVGIAFGAGCLVAFCFTEWISIWLLMPLMVLSAGIGWYGIKIARKAFEDV